MVAVIVISYTQAPFLLRLCINGHKQEVKVFALNVALVLKQVLSITMSTMLDRSEVFTYRCYH